MQGRAGGRSTLPDQVRRPTACGFPGGGRGWRNRRAAFSWEIFATSSAESAAEHLGEHGLGVGPGAVAVRVVGLEGDVVDADRLAGRERRRVVDRGEPEVAVQDLGRAQVAGEVVAVARPVDDVLEPVVQHRDPADAALAHDDLQVGVLHRVARPQPLRARAQRELAEQTSRRAAPSARPSACRRRRSSRRAGR